MKSTIDRQAVPFKDKCYEGKTCVGKGCSNEAVVSLEINYLKKPGYFCKSCARDLLKLDLVKSTICIPEDISNDHSNASIARKSTSGVIHVHDGDLTN